MNVLRILRHPRAAVVGHDIVMVAVSWLAAGWIFHRSGFTGVIQNLPLLSELLLVLTVQGIVLWFTGLYKGLWRFASFPDMWNIARASMFGTVLIIAALTVLYGSEFRQVLGAILVYPGILFLTRPIKPLDRGERHAVGVDRADGTIALAQAEGRTEILGRGADVTDRSVLGLIIPTGDGQAVESIEDLATVDLGEVFL